MNTRPFTKKEKHLVPTDLAKGGNLHDAENVSHAKLLLRLLLRVLPRTMNDMALAMVLIEEADGPVQLILLILVHDKLEGLDPKIGLGKAMVFVHNRLVESLQEVGYLTEDDSDSDPDSDHDTDPDIDEDSLPCDGISICPATCLSVTRFLVHGTYFPLHASRFSRYTSPALGWLCGHDCFSALPCSAL
jgi:hypothetical protein